MEKVNHAQLKQSTQDICSQSRTPQPTPARRPVAQSSPPLLSTCQRRRNTLQDTSLLSHNKHAVLQRAPTGTLLQTSPRLRACLTNFFCEAVMHAAKMGPLTPPGNTRRHLTAGPATNPALPLPLTRPLTLPGGATRTARGTNDMLAYPMGRGGEDCKAAAATRAANACPIHRRWHKHEGRPAQSPGQPSGRRQEEYTAMRQRGSAGLLV